MEPQQFEEISGKLDRIATLLALTVVKSLKPEEQVALLSSVGYQPSQIAGMINKTPNAVRIILHQLRKKAKQPRPVSTGSDGRTLTEEQKPAE